MPKPLADLTIPKADEMNVEACYQNEVPQTPPKPRSYLLRRGSSKENHIRFLLTVNNEAKMRRSTKSLVLGKAKVIGYEELVEAREKRVEKE
ncbi:hypothetical protein BDV95DRAFT_477647, partial [Massariosphaeria phaeospora]